jgi:hypothetical protein
MGVVFAREPTALETGPVNALTLPCLVRFEIVGFVCF